MKPIQRGPAPVAALLLTASLAACASNEPVQTVDPKIPSSQAVEQSTVTTEKSGADLLNASIPELVAAWEPALTRGDLGSVTLITLQLPTAVNSECVPGLQDFQADLLSEYEANGVEGIADVNAENGGARVIDFMRHWGGYVLLAGELCE